jgi:hypothetical protein
MTDTIGDMFAEAIDLQRQAEELEEKVNNEELTEEEAAAMVADLQERAEKFEDFCEEEADKAREERHERLYGNEEND